ncbi:hypothetical protein [Catenuloplanes japonicus]|uniref:hypothetical protein n=1 Tax=Catenuloplanes japonicus TaxID=33876 RepID=UPI000527079E|nr:hypothetical protein [Catenuloplanes japonicus]
MLIRIAAAAALLAFGVPASVDDLKDPVEGLTDRNGPAPTTYQPVVDAYVIRVPWSQLQSAPGTLNTSVIDAALAGGTSVRLRVTAGVDAPGWLKGANPLPWYADGAQIGTIGRFWEPAFDTAYRDLQQRLADVYDDDPRVREVVVSRCTTEFAEPYIRHTGQLALNRPGLQAAGYTAAADDECHRDEIEAHQVWAHTRSYLAFNPFQRIDETTWTGSVDLPFTKKMIDYCRTVLGARCVLGNNSLDPDRPAAYVEMYSYIAAKGAPISYQTATAAKICENQSPCPAALWKATLQLALDYGAGAVELPDGPTGYTSWPLADLETYDDQLTAVP